MKKQTPFILMSIVGCLAILPQPASAGETVKSLRGATEINAPSPYPQPEKAAPSSKPIKREFAEQLPLIPHTIDEYKIDKNTNQCLDCHGKTKETSAGATRISPTHFLDSEGKEMATLASSHYFCVLCHVTQSDAKPLVGNTFRAVPAPKRPKDGKK
ncbi:MAG: nitrate reductase cytochrome c-type subunit [Desulfobulbaceae bacterium]|nr:nitrate reductase cytochrome c-type subunit [Desulfobulbaceae bacterium]HIJ89521.1 nitrate reductase cytochrome c-type subunit [Deltaproteobacteria bacterium]